MCGIVLRIEAKHEALRRYFYGILNISEEDPIPIGAASRYVQLIRKADEDLSMREQDIALAAYLAGQMGGVALTSSDLRAGGKPTQETAQK